MKKGAALLGLLFASFVGCADAQLARADDGVGEVLIFPLVTTKNDYDSLIQITNYTGRAIAAQAIIRNGADGEVAGSFRVLIDAQDVWTGVITAFPEGPSFVRSSDWMTFDGDGQRLRGEDMPIDTAEGWLELYALGTLDERQISSYLRCSFHILPVCSDDLAGEDGILEPIESKLSGKTMLITVEQGAALSVDATALVGFGIADQSLAAPDVDLSSAPATARIEGQERPFHTGIDAVSAVLTKRLVSAEFSSNPIINAKSDLVLTFPTRHYYTDDKRGPFDTTDYAISLPARMFDVVQGSSPLATMAGLGPAYFSFLDPTNTCANFDPLPPRLPEGTTFPSGPIFNESQSAIVTNVDASVLELETRKQQWSSIYGGDCRSRPYRFIWDNVDATGTYILDFGRYAVLDTNGDKVVGLPLLAFGVTTVSNNTFVNQQDENILVNYGWLNPIKLGGTPLIREQQ